MVAELGRGRDWGGGGGQGMGRGEEEQGQTRGKVEGMEGIGISPGGQRSAWGVVHGDPLRAPGLETLFRTLCHE